MPAAAETLEIEGRAVTISNPGKVFFPRTGHTKLDIVHYYLAVAPGALRGVHGRPMALKRFVNGAEGEAFFQKRAPSSRPPWIETVELRFPSGRTASEIVVRDTAQLAWVLNLGCIDLNPHPVRADDLDHPDELRVDLDPMPGVPWSQVREVALVARAVLEDVGLTGWPKTSGSRGFHVYCRIERRWTFTEVRRAAVALAREVERRAPALATSRWWKEERHGVFVDYNQNAKDRTIASAYSLRPTPDARASTPLTWDEVPDCEAEAFTIETVPERFARIGDPWEGMDAVAGSIDALLELAARDEAAGLPDAPWPPHFEKQSGEAPRVQPSKRRPDGSPAAPGTVPPPAPGKAVGPTGRRRSTMPLLEIARAAKQDEAMAGLERWKQRHPAVWACLGPSHLLGGSLRGRGSPWTRVRPNLRNRPQAQRAPRGTSTVPARTRPSVPTPARLAASQPVTSFVPAVTTASAAAAGSTSGMAAGFVERPKKTKKTAAKRSRSGVRTFLASSATRPDSAIPIRNAPTAAETCSCSAMPATSSASPNTRRSSTSSSVLKTSRLIAPPKRSAISRTEPMAATATTSAIEPVTRPTPATRAVRMGR